MRKNQSKGSALTKAIGDNKPKKTGSSEEYCREGQCSPSKSLDEELYREATVLHSKNPSANANDIYKHLVEKTLNTDPNKLNEEGYLANRANESNIPKDELKRNLKTFSNAFADFTVGAEAAGQKIGYNNKNLLGYEDFQLQKQNSSDDGFGEKFNDITETGKEKWDVDSGKVDALPEKGPHIKPLYGTGSREFFENANLWNSPGYNYWKGLSPYENRAKNLKGLKSDIKWFIKKGYEPEMSEEEINVKANNYLDKAGKFFAEQKLNKRLDSDYRYTDFLKDDMPGEKLPNRDWKKEELMSNMGSLPLKKAVTLPSGIPNPQIIENENKAPIVNSGDGQTLVKNMSTVNNTPENNYQPVNSLQRRKIESVGDMFSEIPQPETPISRALYNNIASDKNATFADTQDAAEVAQQASELQATANRAIDNAQLEQNIQPEPNQVTTTETVQTEQPVGNAMSNIGQVVSIPSNEKPSYLGTTNANEVGNAVVDKNEGYNRMRAQVDPLVVEQLGVQDYYPDINRNIGVGTFSGKRIGSQTIYAGGGVLLPMGLYDARIRALDKKAKEKQAQIDKLKELPDVPAQFQSEYSKNYMNTVYSYLDKHNNNYDALRNDREFNKEMQRLKDLGKELNYTDKYIGGIVDKAADGKGWVPKEMLDKAYNFRSALGDNTSDIVTGKKNVLPLVNQIRAYEDGTKWADDFAKQNFVEGKMGKVPFVFKNGSIKTPEDEKEYADFQQAVKGRDYDRMISGFKKFYDTSAVDSAIDAAFNTKNLDIKTKDAIKSYLLAQVPQDVIEMKGDVVQNENFERQQEANKNFWKQKEFDLKERQGRTHFDSANEIMNSAGVDGKTLNQKIAEINANRNLSTEQKRLKMEQAFGSFGLEGNWDKATRTYVFKEKVSPEMQSKRYDVQPDELMMKVQEPFKQRNGKTVWITKSMPLNVVLAKKPGYLKTLDGTVLGENELSAWRNAKKNNQITLGFTETEKAKGFSMNGKKAEVVTPENMKYFNNNNSRNIVMFKGNAAGIVDKDASDPSTGAPIVSPLIGDVYVTTEISNLPGQQSADAIFGYNVNKKELSNAGERTMSGSSTTQSE